MKVLALSCGILACTATAKAQDAPLRPTVDSELWSSLTVRWKPIKADNRLVAPSISRKLQATAELGYRSADQFFAGRQFYIDLGGRYRLNKRISLAAEHRYAARTGNDDRQRTSIQGTYSHSWERFDFQYRLRLQHAFSDPGSERTFARNRFSVAYNIRKWKLDPEFSLESFTWAGHRGIWHRGFRYSIGTDWSPWKGHRISYKLVHDREYGRAWPEFRFIHSIGWTINLDRT